MNERRVVEISPKAIAEIDAVRSWWRENRDKAPNAVDDDLLELVERLETGAQHVGTRARNMPGVRRVLLPRVRYYVYFRIVGDLVQVAAVWHSSRGHQPDLG